MTTVAQALAAARRRLPASEARLLLGHVLSRPAEWLLAHDDDDVDGDALRSFAALTARRAAGEPVAYLLGRREFHGRDFVVSPAVLIPRPETELLVDCALRRRGHGVPARILDLGTGSGCVAVTLACERTSSLVTAVDISPSALAVAEANARRHGANVRFVESNWFSALGDERFDLVVANPPYVAAGDAHLDAGDLRHEPGIALASGTEGLDAIRTIISDARTHLIEGGWLLLEHGFDQGNAVRNLLEQAGYRPIDQWRDLSGIVRVSGGQVVEKR